MKLYYKINFCSTILLMAISVQARLDDESEAALDRIALRTGWSTSRILREGITTLDSPKQPRKPFKLIGQGEFSSPYTDLATNKKYMAGFGLTRAQREALVKQKKRA